MERFAPALRRLAGELELPRRARSELLLEMAADLEALYEHHRSRGVPEAEAARRAEETILGSAEVIRRLGRLHDSPWRGWAEDVAARLAGGIDLVLLGAGVLPVVALAGAVSAWTIAAEPAPAVWGILLIGVLMAVVVAADAARLLGGRSSGRRGLPTLLVLAALAPSLGLLSLLVGLHRVGTGLPAVPAAVSPAGSAGAEQAALATMVARDGAALLVGLLVGIAGLLAWFVLLDREAKRASREVDALLAGDAVGGPSPPQEDDGDTLPLIRRRHG